MENGDIKPQNQEGLKSLEHLNIMRCWILNAGQKIKEEQDRVNNPWKACFNTVLHVVHGNLELASYEEDALSQEEYEKISSRIAEIIEEVGKDFSEISDDKKAELLEKLKHILD